MKMIAYYSGDLQKRGPCVLSARNKLDYIIESFLSNGETVSVLSLCNKSFSAKVLKPERETVSDGFDVFYPKCRRISKKNVVGYFLYKAFLTFSLLRFLKKHVEKNETVYLYHSTYSLPFVRFLKKKKNARIILEVEEVYGDVSNDAKLKKREYKAFSASDAFVFSTELLDEKINRERKPSAVIYGSYRVEPGESKKADGEEVHCVYAGTFDVRKGGAAAAVDAAEFLPQNYHIHVLGFGSEKDREELEVRIAAARKKNGAQVTFGGALAGKEYSDYLQSCDIGLSTQNPDGAFNDTSFPSKILSYLSNGLRVVTVKIPVVERTKIGPLMRYYDVQDPKAIAEAIKKEDLSVPFDGRKAVGELDEQFKRSLKELLDALKA